ncbi:MAG: hypothetical protein PHR83_14820 [Paludibacter sp.]|nr:hypothetical protein [Paludibacter sp.]
MNAELNTFTSYFCLVDHAVEYIITGKSNFKLSDFDLYKKLTYRIVSNTYYILELGGFDDEHLIEEYKKATIENEKLVRVDDVIEMINERMLQLSPSDKYIYAKRLITTFKPISSKFVRGCKKDDVYCLSELHNNLINNNSDLRRNEPEQYLKNCFDLLNDFATKFMNLCNDFNIDIDKIQNELGFILITNNPKSNNGLTPPIIIRLLTKKQSDFLYKGLVSGAFLPIDKTGLDEKAFCYLFGGIGKPTDLKPLKWLKNVQLLRELLTALKNSDIKLAEMERTTPKYFIKKNGKCIKLSKAKHVESTDSDIIANLIQKIATL